MSKLEELLKKHCRDGVEYKNLGEVCNVQSGGTPLKTKVEYWENGNIKWLGSGVCKNKKTVDEITDYISELGLEKSSAKLMKKNTTLIALVGATIGKVAFLPFEAAINQNIAGVYPIDTKKLNPSFVYYICTTYYKDFISLGNGKLTMANLSFVRNLKIPVPPIEVQKEIVRILDEFTEKTNKLQELLHRETILRKKQYEYYREKLLTFNDDVEWKCLGELLQPKGYIRGPFGSALKKDFFVKDGVPVYEQQHAIYNKRVFRYFVDCERADKLKRFTVKPYDIIISCSGTIGKISIIMPEDRIGIINQALLILRLDLSKVNVKYIKHYLECFPNLIVTSSGGAITNIEKREIIEKIKIPVPQLEEQERIVNILDKFDALCNDITKGLPAEIELRKKQYEYYRDKLLTFKEKKK